VVVVAVAEIILVIIVSIGITLMYALLAYLRGLLK